MNELENILQSIKEAFVKALPPVNVKRAESFKKFVKDKVKTGQAGLKEHTALTRKIQNTVHNPLHSTGELMNAMKVYTMKDGGVEVGFRRSDMRKPEGSSITYAKIAYLHTTGFRVPLTGKKGEKVRGWFASQHDVHFKRDTKYLIVRPRPFLKSTFDAYAHKGRDLTIVSDWLNKILQAALHV